MSGKPGGEVPQSYWNTMIVIAAVLAVVMAVVVLIAIGIFLGVLRW